VSSLVVLPTYQEADNIPVILRLLRAVVDQVDVLVVDDGSPDGTADIAEAVGGELGGIFVLRRTEKRGLGEAYRAGFAWGLAAGTTPWSRWTPTCPTTRLPCRCCSTG
jgi:dolichol-phosphate mannosyltransferase